MKTDSPALPKYCGISDVAAIGMDVDECARLMARFPAVKKKCVFIGASRMSGIGKWMYEDAVQFQALENCL